MSDMCVARLLPFHEAEGNTPEPPVIGGGECMYDWQCGWLSDDFSKFENRTNLSSGNNGRCIDGQCRCANVSTTTRNERYGCSRCSVKMKLYYSYTGVRCWSSKTLLGGAPILEHHTNVHRIDMCDVPAGGARCQVGRCYRNEKGVFTCEGDRVCQVIGGDRRTKIPAGVCVGEEGHEGVCVCARDHWCHDCSLHSTDIVSGLGLKLHTDSSGNPARVSIRCGEYQSGGGDCLAPWMDRDISAQKTLPSQEEAGASILAGNMRHHRIVHQYIGEPDPLTFGCHEGLCVAGSAAGPAVEISGPGPNLQHRPYCRCPLGFACKRCRHKVSELQRGFTRCPCDSPWATVTSGHYMVHENTTFSVNLTTRPYDTEDECEIRWRFVRCIPPELRGANVKNMGYHVQHAMHTVLKHFRQDQKEKHLNHECGPDASWPWTTGSVASLTDMPGESKVALWWLQARAVPRPSHVHFMEPSHVIGSGPYVFAHACRHYDLWIPLLAMLLSLLK